MERGGWEEAGGGGGALRNYVSLKARDFLRYIDGNEILFVILFRSNNLNRLGSVTMLPTYITHSIANSTHTQAITYMHTIVTPSEGQNKEIF